MAQVCKKHPDREALAFCVKCGCAMCPECERPYNGRPYCADCLKKRRTGESTASRAAAQTAVAVEAAAGKTKRKLFGALRTAGRKAVVAGPATGVLRIPRMIRRTAARLIDIAAVIAFAMPVSFLFRFITRQFMADVGGLGFDLSIYVAVVLVGTAYFIVSEYLYGKTLGKFLLGLKTVKYEGGARLTLAAVCWRWTGFLAAVCWSYVGYRLGMMLMDLMGIFKQGIPFYSTLLAGFASLMVAVMFSLGLLMTFVGKYKRGFHDLLGGSIVIDDISGDGRIKEIND